jgi:hypothetical protein
MQRIPFRVGGEEAPALRVVKQKVTGREPFGPTTSCIEIVGVWLVGRKAYVAGTLKR